MKRGTVTQTTTEQARELLRQPPPEEWTRGMLEGYALDKYMDTFRRRASLDRLRLASSAGECPLLVHGRRATEIDLQDGVRELLEGYLPPCPEGVNPWAFNDLWRGHILAVAQACVMRPVFRGPWDQSALPPGKSAWLVFDVGSRMLRLAKGDERPAEVARLGCEVVRVLDPYEGEGLFVHALTRRISSPDGQEAFWGMILNAASVGEADSVEPPMRLGVGVAKVEAWRRVLVEPVRKVWWWKRLASWYRSHTGVDLVVYLAHSARNVSGAKTELRTLCSTAGVWVPPQELDTLTTRCEVWLQAQEDLTHPDVETVRGALVRFRMEEGVLPEGLGWSSRAFTPLPYAPLFDWVRKASGGEIDPDKDAYPYHFEGASWVSDKPEGSIRFTCESATCTTPEPDVILSPAQLGESFQLSLFPPE